MSDERVSNEVLLAMLLIGVVLTGCDIPTDNTEHTCVTRADTHQQRIECINTARKNK